MINSEKIIVRGYVFFHNELTGYNPYNDSGGAPIELCEELSHAWCEAAYNYRLSLREVSEVTFFV